MCDENERLIELVRSKPPIWDRAHGGHHNRYMLQTLWNAIGKELGMSGNLAAKKWKLLRQNFSRKLKRTGDPCIDEMTTSWPYFQSMLFMEDQFSTNSNNVFIPIKMEQNSDNADETSSDVNDDYAIDEDSCNKEASTTPQRASPTTLNHSYGAADHASTSRSSTPSNTSKYAAPGYRKRPNSQVSPEQSPKRERLGVKNDHDDDLEFFHSMLPYIRKLTERKKMIFRIKIQKMLYDISYSENDSFDSNECVLPFPA